MTVPYMTVDEFRERAGLPSLQRGDAMRVMHMLHTLDVEPGDLGSTVRLGTKWDTALPGTELRLCVCTDRCTDADDCGKTPVERVWTIDTRAEGNDTPLSCANCTLTGVGLVEDLWSGQFSEVPARLLEIEHEERSRQYSGLLASMKKAYGADFLDSSWVTVVVYRRTR